MIIEQIIQNLRPNELVVIRENTEELRVNGAYVAKGVVCKHGEYVIAPALFQHKPESDARGIYYAAEGFVIALPDDCKQAFEAIPSAELPKKIEWGVIV
jgi:hypothetical protein